MCSTCGCGQPEAGHDHDHDRSHSRILRIERDVLAENDAHAARNRAWFVGRGVLAVNLMSSPGSGKTTLLVRTIADLNGRFPIAVIEGDQRTSLDAERIRETGVPAFQINTGKGCHLDAHMVSHAIEALVPERESVLFIENVGNLVCPAAFDLGEAHKAVILSVTEGDDKPLKYPDMFAAATVMIVAKIDLLPHLRFDIGRCIDGARRINPGIDVLCLSAETGQGLAEWYDWIGRHRHIQEAARPCASPSPQG
ncbi:MAG: hydrogenase nickel incorporation protein HypB [Alphaproteobacteria bacterium]|nr:hydrogenase nickel incorporation protein HypB [Alphaproteobacteria bacterium]